MPDIQIEIDGKKIVTQQGKMIIQVADENDIYIPRFCYHKKLSIAANCRMCLVEVEKAPKTLPACATPISDGMKVFTQSAKTLESQRAVMEFLLINHPLDCPICDQGGQCELQDFSVGYGKDHSDYKEEKRAVANDDFGPLISTEMTRCIHCTRCVRFGREIAGVREIGMTGRGEHSQISTYVQHTVGHELSGNIIDLCPVGALLSKPYLYRARAWELTAMASIAAHDGVGSNISVHVRRNEVMRVTPRENDAVNESWLSDRDRFSYQGLHVDRLEKPMIKDQNSGEWHEVSWQTALNYVADAVEKIVAAHGSDAIGAFLSPNSTVEEAYLLKKLCDHVGTRQIEYRLHKSGAVQVAPTPGLGINFADIETQQTIVIIGSHVRNDQPLIAHRVRKAALKGAKVHVVDSVRHPYAFDLASEKIVKPSQFLSEVQSLMQELRSLASPALVIMGEYALNHSHADNIYAVLSAFTEQTNSTLAVLPAGANVLGCHHVGAWIQADKKSTSILKAYLLHGVEPEFDVANPRQFESDLLLADLVVSITPFISEHMKKVANVLLPCAAFTETSGTFVNLAGHTQSFMGCVVPKGEARPAWKIFRVLGNLLGAKDFDFENSEDILRAFQHLVAQTGQTKNTLVDVSGLVTHPVESNPPLKNITSNDHTLEVITLWPDCRSDSLVRRAAALNKRASEKRYESAHVHPETAEHLADLPFDVVVDEAVAPGAMLISGGTSLAMLVS